MCFEFRELVAWHGTSGLCAEAPSLQSGPPAPSCQKVSSAVRSHFLFARQIREFDLSENVPDKATQLGFNLVNSPVWLACLVPAVARGGSKEPSITLPAALCPS